MSEEIKNKIIDNLREVYDPEIPINVYDLGLIYEITMRENNNAHILMTLTSPACPTGDYIREMVEDAVKNVDEVNSVEVEITFEPLWSPDKITPEAKEELGFGDENNEDLAVKNVFGTKKEDEEKICFKCSASSNNVPLLKCFYKGEDVNLCPKCMVKF